MIELSDQDRRVMFTELMELARAAKPQRENQFTVAEFAEEMGIGQKRASYILGGLWKAGQLKRERVEIGRAHV